VFGPPPIKFGTLFVGEGQFTVTLGVGETLPKRHGELGPITGWKLEELRERGGLHALILSRGGFASQQRISRAISSATLQLGIDAYQLSGLPL